jgi:hypothetical protein
MIAVAIAAVDFAALRAMGDFPRIRLLVVGALPMANVLGAAILIAQRSPETRPFLLGFAVFGALALALFAAWASSLPKSAGPMRSYLTLGLQPVAKLIGPDRPRVLIPVAAFGMMVLLAWPQAALALMGGLLSQRFRATRTRR